MYDVVVVGKGLSGLLSAIWSKEQGKKVAIVAKGTGKIIQSTGVMELYPKLSEREKTISKSKLEESINKFKSLTKSLDYPYSGHGSKTISIVTAAGYIKETNLYPETIKPIMDKGHVVIVGFEEIIDFQPKYVKGNLEKERPSLNIDTVTVSLGKNSLRTMTQLDGARLLDLKEVRDNVIEQIKDKMSEQNISRPDLFIFPASLGMKNWRAVINEFHKALGAEITEAPGMPPNATAIRLHEALLKEAIKRGIRFYSDTEVIGSHMKETYLKSIVIKNNTFSRELKSFYFINATGGVLGGGLEVTESGFVDNAFQLEVDDYGRYRFYPQNLFTVGASRGTKVTQHGITGGLYSILSSYESILELGERGIKHA